MNLRIIYKSTLLLGILVISLAATKFPLVTTPQATLSLDFANGYYYQPGVGRISPTSVLSVTNSGGYATNADGSLTNFPANTLRIGSGTGLLVEEARTNGVRNSMASGAGVGVAPTNWTVSGGSGITPTVLGTGTEGGINYIDVNISGTPSSNGTILDLYYDTSQGIPAVTGQTWTSSAYVKLQSGSMTNTQNLTLRFDEENSSGGFITNGGFSPFTPTSGNLNTDRVSLAYTTVGGVTTAFIRPNMAINSVAGLGAVSLTLRIGWPQIELGAFSTSPINTTTAAVTRNADNIALSPSIVSTLNSGVFSLLAVGGGSASVGGAMVSVNGAGVPIFIGSSSTVGSTDSGNANSFNATFGTGSSVGLTKVGMSSARSLVVNNGTVASVAGFLTTPVTSAALGGRGSFYYNGSIRQFNIWNSVLPSATLKSQTNWLLRRDIDPASNDNDPMWLEKAA